MKKIFVSGETILVSDKDFLFLVGYSWNLNNCGYAVAHINARSQFMHRVVVRRMGLDLARGLIVDHIDGNKYNNRRENLRLVTYSQNRATDKRYRNSISGYRGVCWCKYSKKWKAYIRVNNQKIHLGYFNNPEEAHNAYCKAEEHYFGGLVL